MSVRQFFDVVPKSAKAIAAVIGGAGGLIGLAVAWAKGGPSNSCFVPCLAAALGIGLLVGAVMATWTLGLGFVYADGRRRGMPPILWTLIAALIPNLLGFLLYFALRKPIPLPCPQCGRPMSAEHRFCSWCGYGGNSTPSATP